MYSFSVHRVSEYELISQSYNRHRVNSSLTWHKNSPQASHTSKYWRAPY